MNKKIGNETIGKIIVAALAIGAFFYVKHNFTFNFVALFVALLGFMTLPLWITERPKRYIVDPQTRSKTLDYVRNQKGRPVFNPWASRIYALAIWAFGCLALYALGNYFNAHNNVYYNYEHHALRVDGVKVEGKDFVLASAERDAFLDVPTINGDVVIKGYDEEGVHLELKGVTTPIYMKQYSPKSKDPVGYKCANELMVPFRASDRVEIIFKASSSSEPSVVSFTIKECHEDGILGGIVKKSSDSIECDFTEGQYTGISSFHTFIRNGYSLEGMASDVPLKTDLTGINVVRADVALNCKRRELYDKYSKRPYYIELEKGHSVRTVKVYGEKGLEVVKNVSEVESDETELTIKYNEPFYIGSGDDKSESIYFALAEDKTLQVLYELPKYQRLTSSDGGLESTVMVTSTLVNPNANGDGDSGLIENLTDNVLLFDVFNNYSNSFNIVPFYLSYMGGPTNERMQFVVMTPSSDAVSCGAKIGKDHAYFSGVKSKNGTEWLIQVEDFKSTSPFRSTKMAWILFGSICLCMLSLLYSGQRRLSTGLEYAVYLVMIAFLSVRFFLMWRVTVFPPLATISWFEFEHFRDSKWLNVALLGLGIFFGIITLIKVVLNYTQKHKITLLEFLSRIRGLLIAAALVAVCALAGLVLNWKAACVLAAAILVVAVLIRVLWPGFLSKVAETVCNPGVMFGLITLVGVVVFLIAEVSSTPVLTVLLPVFAYLVMDALIYGLFAKTYLQDFKRNHKLDAVGERATAFALSMWNMLLISGVTLIADGGYGVMFTMFALFSLWFKIADLYQYTRYDKDSKTVADGAFWVLFAILTLIVIFYKRLFLLLINSFVAGTAWLSVTLACLVLLLIVVCVLLLLDQDAKSILAFVKMRYVPISIISALFVAILVIGVIKGPEKLSGSHMEYRCRVHMENAGSILYNRIHTPTEQNKFMQASLNDWILYEYERIGDDVKAFGENGNGYFKIQPQSKLGAMWFAQTTDICISRYVIAEHGKTLAWLFVAAFAALLLIALREVSGYRWSRIVAVQVTLLFAVQSLMILLANTRAFIFFGQDFPLVSITSRLSSLYFFMLMMLCVVSAILGRNKYLSDFADNLQLDTKLQAKNGALRNNIIFFFVVAPTILYFTGKSDKNVVDDTEKPKTENVEVAKPKRLNEKQLRKKAESKKKDESAEGSSVEIKCISCDERFEVSENDAVRIKHVEGQNLYVFECPKCGAEKDVRASSFRSDMKWLDEISFYKNGVYDVDTLLTVVNAELESIVNPAFRNYQKNVQGAPRLQRNMSVYVAQVMDDTVYMRNAIAQCSEFTRKMLTRYRVEDSRDNSVRSLICVRNTRSFEFKKNRGQNTYKVLSKDTLEFCTSLEHFKYELPKKVANRWDGHVVEVVRDNYPDTVYKTSGNGWDAVYIPAAYTGDGQPVQIVRAVDNGGFDLVGINALLSVTSKGLNVVNVSQRDFLISRDRVIDDLPLERYSYIARNILLNGKRTFIYPNGKKMFWARELTASKMRELKSGDPDAEITVSTDLSNRLYDVYMKHVGSEEGSNDDRTVICADGDGRIRAMVDYRSDPAFRLNPNDYKSIGEVSEFLSANREKGRTTESRFFGNYANNALRRGPGSTQKPIVWSAVTSMYNTGWWNNLKMAPVPLFRNADNKSTLRTADKTYYYFKKYAGHSMESQFKSRITDEGNENPLNLREYMYKSSNYYNSVMAYLGAYSVEEISSASNIFRDSKVYRGMTLPVRPVRSNYSTEAQFRSAMDAYGDNLKRYEAAIKSFPTMYIDKGERKPVTFDRFLNESMALNAQALLPKGLYDNFGLEPIVSKPMSKRPYTYFNMSIRNGKTSDRQLNEYVVRSVAIGNNSVWQVSPRRMAEMYGRLVGLNKSYTLSLDAKTENGSAYKTAYDQFDLHKTWADPDKYQEVRKELLLGMSDVFSTKYDATAKDLKLVGTVLGKKDGQTVTLSLDGGSAGSSSKFYIYGKTGTINGYWGSLDGEDHMLATVITDRPLSQCSAEELKDVKFYVIYQVDYSYKGHGWKEVDRDIILEVLHSKAFKKYMGLK